MEISSDKFIFNDKRGKLISLSNKNLKIKIKRVFIITSSKESIVRGENLLSKNLLIMKIHLIVFPKLMITFCLKVVN